MSDRLSCVAGLIPPEGAVIDVGTDHGFLPVYLVENCPGRRVGASDINPGPLAHARESAERYGVEERIEFYLSDGLASCGAGWDAVVMAGMGGETMADILAAAPFPLEGVKLVLQPQSKLREVERYLEGIGFGLSAARLALDAGRMYVSFLASFGERSRSLAEALFEGRDPRLFEYLAAEAARLRRAIDGMERAHGTPEGLLEAREELSRINTMMEEIKRW